MNMERIKENKLGTILQFSVPSIIAMLLSTVLTLTDGYFTGNYVGEQALAAINLGLPILYFYLGVGLCVGVGGTVISGRLLGAKKQDKASQVFSQTIVTAAVICVVTSLLVFCLFSPILKILRADGELDGKPQVCMFVSIGGCILNAVLDDILVAKFAVGVSGSAAASLIVQAVTVLVQLLYFAGPSLSLRFRRFHFDRAVNRETILNGSSEFIGEMASAVSMFAFNYVLMKYVGAEGVAAFSILGFAVYGYSMISIGFGQGLTPLVSRCWGAEEHKTAMELRTMTNRILAVIGAVFALSFLVFGRRYAGMFGCSSSVADMVSVGFCFYAVTFFIMGYNVINSMYFTSCGDAKASALISALRGLVLLLIFTLIFPAIWGMTGVWMATPVTETITVMVSTWLLIKQRRIMESRG